MFPFYTPWKHQKLHLVLKLMAGLGNPTTWKITNLPPYTKRNHLGRILSHPTPFLKKPVLSYVLLSLTLKIKIISPAAERG